MRPGEYPSVRLTRDGKNVSEADEAATRAFLDAAHQPDGWHCPRCPQVFKDPEKFLEHLTTEINKAVDALRTGSYLTAGKPAPTQPGPGASTAESQKPGRDRGDREK